MRKYKRIITAFLIMIPVTATPAIGYAQTQSTEELQIIQETNDKNGLIDGIYYKDGKAFTGTADGIYYKDGVVFTGIADSIYYESGIAFTGTKDGVYYKNGIKFTGTEDGVYYEEGKIFSGTVNGKTYTDGIEGVKKIKIDGVETLVPDKGYMWTSVNGKMFFVENGAVVKGWKYFTKAQGENTSHWSFFDLKTGALYTGWRQMGKAEGEKTVHWSYFGDNGWLRTGWQQMSTKNNPDGGATVHWSYFGDNGWLRTGWQQMSTKNNPDGGSAAHWSYFGNNGWLRTGWVQLGKGTNEPDGNSAKHWSYFGDNGWLRTNWQYMGKGTSNPDGNAPEHWSYFGDNGWLRTGWQQMGTASNPDGNNKVHWSFFGSNGWLATGTVNTENGVKGTFDSSGWLATTRRDIRSYINQDEYGYFQGCAGAALLTAFQMRGILTGMNYPKFMDTMLYAPIERPYELFRANPNNGYHGDPKAHNGYIGNGTGYGNAIYPAGIIKWVDKLKKEGYQINCEVTDISGSDTGRLIEEVRKGNTPIVQVTWHFLPKTPSKEWWGYYVPGHHFVALLGYDHKNDRFNVADPDWPDDANNDKTRWIDGNTFRNIYNIQKHVVLVK